MISIPVESTLHAAPSRVESLISFCFLFSSHIPNCYPVQIKDENRKVDIMSSDSDNTEQQLPPGVVAPVDFDDVTKDNVNLSFSGRRRGWTPFTRAAFRGKQRQLKRLLALGADVNQARSNGCTAMYLAAERGHLEVVRWLFEEAKAEAAKPNRKGATPLYIAAQENHLQVVKFLVETCGCDPAQMRANGACSLHIAAEIGNISILQYFCQERECDPNQSKHTGASVLYAATRKGQLDVVRWLLTHTNADPNAANNKGSTPLHVSVSAHAVELTKCLLSAECKIKCDPNKRNADGWTPLTVAAHKGDVELLKLLLEAGALVGNRDRSNKTALQRAKRNRHQDCVDALMEYGATPDSRSTPLVSTLSLKSIRDADIPESLPTPTSSPGSPTSYGQSHVSVTVGDRDRDMQDTQSAHSGHSDSKGARADSKVAPYMSKAAAAATASVAATAPPATRAYAPEQGRNPRNSQLSHSQVSHSQMSRFDNTVILLPTALVANQKLHEERQREMNYEDSGSPIWACIEAIIGLCKDDKNAGQENNNGQQQQQQQQQQQRLRPTAMAPTSSSASNIALADMTGRGQVQPDMVAFQQKRQGASVGIALETAIANAAANGANAPPALPPKPNFTESMQASPLAGIQMQYSNAAT
jgi:ankyrin repeat protein